MAKTFLDLRRLSIYFKFFHYEMTIQLNKIECKRNFNLITFYRKQVNFMLFIHDYLTQRQSVKINRS